MSKILILGDTHYGCRNDNQAFYSYMDNFFNKVVFPYIDQNNISHFIHLGDVLDNRRQINVQTMKRLREDFLEPLSYRIEKGLRADFICGNHDLFNKTNSNISSLDELINEKYDYDIFVHKNPFYIKDILLLPWINDENREISMEAIKNTSAKYCLAHLELKGFETQKGIISSHGDDPKVFSKFHKVLSGHYHSPSHSDNIHYIGACFQFNWSDYGNNSGFVILDTESGRLDYFPNPYKMFNKIDYEEDKKIDISFLQNSYVKINVLDKKSETKFKNFIDSIYNLGIIDLQINDIQEKVEIIKLDEKIDSTLDVFKEQISSLEIKNKNILEALTYEIYREAQNG